MGQILRTEKSKHLIVMWPKDENKIWAFESTNFELMASASTRASLLLNLTKSGLSGRNLEHASLFFCIQPPPVYLPPTFNRILSYTHHFTNMLTLTSTALSMFWTNHPSFPMALNSHQKCSNIGATGVSQKFSKRSGELMFHRKCSKSSGELMFHSNRRRLMCHNCNDLEILKRLLKLELWFFLGHFSFFLGPPPFFSGVFFLFGPPLPQIPLILNFLA